MSSSVATPKRGPARRNPWPVRLAVGCGGLVLAGFLAVVGLVAWVLLPHRTEMGLCRSELLGSSCTHVPAPVIGRIMAMELPPGTMVRESHYTDWQDDHLTAVVVVPAAAVGQWEASLRGWSPAYACDDPTATCPPSCRQGATCAGHPDPADREVRSYVRTTEPDGSIRLELTWFET